MIIADVLRKWSTSTKIAAIENKRKVTYKDLYSQCIEKSSIIKSANFNSGEIGILINNSIDYIVAYFTIAFIGKIIVPIDPNTKKTELLKIIDNCNIKMIITNDKNYDNLITLVSSFEEKIVLFNISNNNFLRFGKNYDYNQKKDYKKIYSSDSIALILGTSGTNNNPKRVALSNKNLISNVKSIIHSLKIKEDDISLISLPIYLASANTSQFLTHFFLGGQIVIMEGLFFPNKFMEMVEKYKITNFTGIPFMMNVLFDYNYHNNFNIDSLRYMCFGGGTLSNEIYLKMNLNYPKVSIIKMYGLTEASARVSHLIINNKNMNKLNSVGKTILGVMVKVVNEEGNELTTGDIGEIIVNGNNVMRGYHNNKELSEKVLQNDWLHTGDIGKIDEDGYIYILGRKKNVIISCGYNIHPEEIEEVLLDHPHVKEAYVYGIEDSLYDEVPVLEIVPDGDSNLSKSELFSYIKQNLSFYKIPKEIKFVSSINKTSSGKIKRVRQNQKIN
ncbi:MAG: class I adenylate-forming enzyme family protein [Clostridiales bacterium]